jgi:hypothetical protein
MARTDAAEAEFLHFSDRLLTTFPGQNSKVKGAWIAWPGGRKAARSDRFGLETDAARIAAISQDNFRCEFRLTEGREALGRHHPKNRSRGRQGAPAGTVLHLLILKHVRNLEL